MDKEYPPEAWKRLGKALEARRGQLGYGFRQREGFLAARGGPPPSLKTLARLERGERTAYPPGTVTRLESMYEWAPGSFDAVLAGGEAEPLGAGPAPAPPSLRPLPSAPPVDPEAPAEVVLRDLMERHPGDRMVQFLGADDEETVRDRIDEILDWLEWRRSKHSRRSSDNSTTG